MIDLASPPEVTLLAGVNNIPTLTPSSPRAFQTNAGGQLNGNLAVTGTTQFSGVVSLGWQSPPNNIALNVVFNFAGGIGGVQYGAKFVQGMASDASGGIGLYFQPTGGGASTTYGTVQALVLDSPNYNSSTHITNAYGLYVANQARAVTTNAFGIFIEKQSGGSGINSALAIANNSNLIRQPAAVSTSLSVESGDGYVFLSAKLNAHMGGNAYWDGANWNRFDVSQAASYLYVSGSGMALSCFPSGANPLSAGQVVAFQVDPTGLVQIANRIKLNSDTGWTLPTYLNSWARYGGGGSYGAGGYRKLPDGTVRLRGLITGGTQNTIIFQLPVGCRPTDAMLFVVAIYQGVCRLNVNTDGTVSYGEMLSGVWSNVWCSLNEISFMGEQ